VHVRRSRVLLLAAAIGLAVALSMGAILVPQQASADRTSRTSRQSGAKRAAAARRLRARRRVHDVALGRTLTSIHSARDDAWHWEAVMSAPQTRYAASADRSQSLAYRRMVLTLWRRRDRQARQLAEHPPRLKDWLCIHHYEGAWNDPNGPYYGGLQMDMTFQETYGASLLRRKGTADHWTPLEQIWVAERAYRSGRGFYPWPNTARYCGLL
jgi:hypothetical protein